MVGLLSLAPAQSRYAGPNEMWINRVGSRLIQGSAIVYVVQDVRAG